MSLFSSSASCAHSRPSPRLLLLHLSVGHLLLAKVATSLSLVYSDAFPPHCLPLSIWLTGIPSRNSRSEPRVCTFLSQGMLERCSFATLYVLRYSAGNRNSGKTPKLIPSRIGRRIWKFDIWRL